MTGTEILKTTFLDLLFENRNKSYGAYVLRKQYNQRLATALGISISAILLLMLLFLQTSTNASMSIEDDSIEDVIVRMQTIPEQPKAPVPPKQVQPQKMAAPVAQQQFTQIHITSNPVDVTDVPMQTALEMSAIANSTTDGEPAEAMPALETATEKEPVPDAQTTTAPSYAEPQFPGGAAAWAAFLARYLQAPETLEAGEKKTVLVKFLVSAEGVVTAFEIVQSAGNAFDGEVIRVLKKMPKWKPALQNGVPVGVPFTQPVTFIGMDE